MALHCAATLLLVSTARPERDHEPGLAATYGPWGDGADVVSELQAVADQHRGERVLVALEPAALAVVMVHLGRRSSTEGGTDRVRLEVGDDGWAVAPWSDR